VGALLPPYPIELKNSVDHEIKLKPPGSYMKMMKAARGIKP
jgi:hypothetical protein